MYLGLISYEVSSRITVLWGVVGDFFKKLSNECTSTLQSYLFIKINTKLRLNLKDFKGESNPCFTQGL